MARLLAYLAFFAALVFADQAAAEGRRVALVIGNDRYSALAPLAKAGNDARGVAAALREIGFDDVLEATDTGRRDMNRSVAEFTRRVQEGDTAFFFYAGHGVAVAGVNYLLPTDFPALGRDDDEELIRDESKSADEVLEQLRERKPARIFMILDACRENPLKSKDGRSVGRNAGLASAIDPGRGAFILYSAGGNQVALDGLGASDLDPNSVFTRKLIPLIKIPGLSQVDLAKKLQQQVAELASTVGHDQNPSYYDEIPGEFALNGNPLAKDRDNSDLDNQRAETNKPAAAVQASVPSAAERWQFVKDAKDEGMLKAFIDAYGHDPLYRKLAERELAALIPRLEIAPQARKPAPDGFGSCADVTLGSVQAKVCASSVLKPGQGNSYRISNLGDGALQTAWVEGVRGHGVGQGILISFEVARTITAIKLVNGYVKSRDIFSKNSRVRELFVTTSSDYRSTVTLADSAKPQRVDLPPLEDIEWLTLEIADVYPGWKYTDTAISEIELE